MFACAYGFLWFSSVFHRFPLGHAIVSFKSLHEWNHHFYVVQAALEMFCYKCGMTVLILFALAFFLTGTFVATSVMDQLITLSPAWNYLLFLTVDIDVLLLWTMKNAYSISSMQDLTILQLKLSTMADEMSNISSSQGWTDSGCTREQRDSSG